jgi:Ala-tRNA(Pro) deacylase
MPILTKLKEFLDQHPFKYDVITHMGARTAQEVAETQHVPGKQMAKVVMVKTANGTPLMLVLPASHKVNFEKLRRILGTDAELEPAKEFRVLFPDCETGAEPPFGNLFGVEMLVDMALTEDEEIIFNAGSHWQTVKMRYVDYAHLVKPRVASFADHLR